MALVSIDTISNRPNIETFRSYVKCSRSLSPLMLSESLRFHDVLGIGRVGR